MYINNKSKIGTSVMDPNVYNGKNKMNLGNKIFITEGKVSRCIKCLKINNSEGQDRIPKRILVDGINQILILITTKMNKVYCQNKIPGQWQITKVTPLLKQGSANNVVNYTTISNLSSVSKIFKKLILQRLLKIETIIKVDLTDNPQHVIKKNKST